MHLIYYNFSKASWIYFHIAGFSCPSGSVHDFYPDVANCSNFYECSDGNAYHLACKNGLYFNSITKVCDFQSNVNCPASGAPVGKCISL